jgi:hypothetical protein
VRQDLKEYENGWVALVYSEGEAVVVGSGDSEAEARREAGENGFAGARVYHVLHNRGEYILTDA